MGQDKKPTRRIIPDEGTAYNRNLNVARALMAGAGAVSSSMSQEEAWCALDTMGRDLVIEMLASGQLDHEIAYAHNIPVRHFKAWKNRRYSEEERADVQRMQAEGLIARAHILLTFIAEGTATDVALAKKQADMYMWTAVRLNPDKWGRDKPGVDGDDVSRFVVNFGNMQVNNNVDTRHVQVIRGGAQAAVPAEEAVLGAGSLLQAWHEDIDVSDMDLRPHERGPMLPEPEPEPDPDPDPELELEFGVPPCPEPLRALMRSVHVGTDGPES